MRTEPFVRVCDHVASRFAGQVGEVVDERRVGRGSRLTRRGGYVRRSDRWQYAVVFEEWPDRPLWFTEDEVEEP